MYFDHLRTIAESATGYVGGSYEDEMPEFELDEAAAYLPVVCLECQNEFIDMTRASNALLVESAANAIEYGTAFDGDALIEASFEGIKQTIAATFERIRKFIKSIVAKLATRIDTVVKSGEQLWAKYGNSAALNGKNFAGLSVEGYEFKGDKILTAANRVKISAVLNSAFGEKLPSPDKFEKQVNGALAGLSRGANERKNAGLKDMSQSERDKNLIMAVTGVKGLGDNWRDDLHKIVWGEKKVIKYGEGMFTKEGVGALLKNAGGALREIQTSYANLEKEINDLDKQCQASAARAAQNAKGAKKSGADEKAQGNLGLIADYYSNYASMVHQTVSVISYVKQVAISFYNERNGQAKTMLSKMLTYNPGKPKKTEDEKSKNEGYYDDEDAAILEFEL